MQGIGVQRQLLVRTAGVLFQCLVFGVAYGQGGGANGTGENQHNGKGQAQGAGHCEHVSASRADGTGTIARHPRVVMRLVPGYLSAACVCFNRPTVASISLRKPRRVMPLEGPNILLNGR